MAKVIKISDSDKLVPTEQYPYAKWEFKEFNPVQSRLFDIYDNGSNVCVAAATSAGKTVCCEMYLAHEIRKRGGKGIYVGPLKALAKEKEQEWSSETHHFGDLKTFIATGDFRFTASRIKWNPLQKNYTLYDYTKRKVGKFSDKIEMAEKKDTVFNFDLEDLTPMVYVAETLSILELNHFIDKEIKRGNSNISVYLVVLYKKYSLPVSAFILTIIALAVSSMKRRGGMGINLAIGIAIAFAFVFFDKIFGALAEKSSINPLIAVWLPNVLFGILAIYLLKNAKR